MGDFSTDLLEYENTEQVNSFMSTLVPKFLSCPNTFTN